MNKISIDNGSIVITDNSIVIDNDDIIITTNDFGIRSIIINDDDTIIIFPHAKADGSALVLSAGAYNEFFRTHIKK